MHDDITRYKGRYLSLIEREHWEFVTRPNAHAVAVLVATTPEREIVLVEQYRRPLDARVIELPAGLVGDTGDPNEAVIGPRRASPATAAGTVPSSIIPMYGMSPRVVSSSLKPDPIHRTDDRTSPAIRSL